MANIVTYSLSGCCCINEIFGLQYHKNDAKAAMLEFCQAKDQKKVYGYGEDGAIMSLYGHYIFSAVVKDDHNDGKGDNNTAPYGFTYGDTFAKFIRDEGLGTVAESEPARNRVNHPNHHVKVYVWQPDLEGLQKWYKANMPTPKPVVVPKVVVGRNGRVKVA